MCWRMEAFFIFPGEDVFLPGIIRSGRKDSPSFVNALAGDAASSRRRRRVWQVFSSDSKSFSGSFTRLPRDKKPRRGSGAVFSLQRLTMQSPANRQIQLSRFLEAPALHSPPLFVYRLCKHLWSRKQFRKTGAASVAWKQRHLYQPLNILARGRKERINLLSSKLLDAVLAEIWWVLTKLRLRRVSTGVVLKVIIWEEFKFTNASSYQNVRLCWQN